MRSFAHVLETKFSFKKVKDLLSSKLLLPQTPFCHKAAFEVLQINFLFECFVLEIFRFLYFGKIYTIQNLRSNQKHFLYNES